MDISQLKRAYQYLLHVCIATQNTQWEEAEICNSEEDKETAETGQSGLWDYVIVLKSMTSIKVVFFPIM